MAEASEFKFGPQLGFAKAHHIDTQEKVCGLGLGELPKILGFPFNICATAETSNFRFVMRLYLPRPTLTRRKTWHGTREAPKYLGFLFNISAMPCCPLSVRGASCLFIVAHL